MLLNLLLRGGAVSNLNNIDLRNAEEKFKSFAGDDTVGLAGRG